MKSPKLALPALLVKERDITIMVSPLSRGSFSVELRIPAAGIQHAQRMTASKLRALGPATRRKMRRAFEQWDRAILRIEKYVGDVVPTRKRGRK